MEPKISTVIQEALNSRSRKEGCNIEWLAKATGIPQNRIYRRLHSERWSVEEVEKISTALGVRLLKKKI